MDIQEIRLRLVQQALGLGVPIELVLQKVEPLAQFVWRGLDSKTQVKKDAEEKSATLVLKTLRDRFGVENILKVHIGGGGEVFVLASNAYISASIEEFLADTQSPDIFQGRKLKVWIEPPKKPHR